MDEFESRDAGARLAHSLESLSSEGGAANEEIRHLELRFGRLPASYLAFIAERNGAEGFIGDAYIAIWSAREVYGLYEVMGVERFAPGLVVFGSDGGGELFGFDLREGRASIVKVPAVGMAWEYALEVGQDFTSWLTAQIADGSPRPGSPDLRGREIHEIHPVILGGDPVDPSNKQPVTRRQLAELASWWNDKIASMREGGIQSS